MVVGVIIASLAVPVFVRYRVARRAPAIFLDSR